MYIYQEVFFSYILQGSGQISPLPLDYSSLLDQIASSFIFLDFYFLRLEIFFCVLGGTQKVERGGYTRKMFHHLKKEKKKEEGEKGSSFFLRERKFE